MLVRNAVVLGSIVFAKLGNIWVESGSNAKQITDTGRDSMPSWSPDGQWIYFIETVSQRGLFPSLGSPRYYTLTYPTLERMHPDGSGREKLLTGLYRAGGGSYQWFYWLREPVVSPDAHTVALLSDGTDPTRTDVVLAAQRSPRCHVVAISRSFWRATLSSGPPNEPERAWRCRPVGIS